MTPLKIPTTCWNDEIGRRNFCCFFIANASKVVNAGSGVPEYASACSGFTSELYRMQRQYGSSKSRRNFWSKGPTRTCEVRTNYYELQASKDFSSYRTAIRQRLNYPILRDNLATNSSPKFGYFQYTLFASLLARQVIDTLPLNCKAEALKGS